MGFAQGIQAGIQSAQRWGGGQRQKSNPFAAMGAIDATLKQLNKRLHPAVIRNTAAGMANQERALELQERKQDFIESQAAIGQREREDQRRWAAEERTAKELNEQAGLAEEKLPSPGEEYRESMGEIRTQEKHDWGVSKAKQAEDFKVVQWAVANRKAGPIVEFVNRYGSKTSNLRGMSWNEKGEVLVFLENEQEKPGYFKNNEELMKSFVGWMDPKVEAQALKISTEEAGEKRKEREQTRKDYATYNKKQITSSQRRQLRNDSRKRYKEKFENVLGELKENAPDEETWVNEDVEKEIKSLTGKAAKGVAAGSEQAISEKGAAPTYKSYKDPKSGNTMRVYPDGRREVLNPKGEVIASKGGEGEPEFGRTKEGIPYGRAKIKKPTEKKVPETAKKKATSYGTATYTDPKTGKKMKATMNPDGSITTEEVGDEKKKKRGPGYGKQGYKPRSINK